MALKEFYDNVYNSACDHFSKIERRIKERKATYVKSKCVKHTNTVCLITLLSTLAISAVNIVLGLITQPLYSILGCFALSCIAGMADITISWNKIQKKSEIKFEELESTKRTREISDKAYVNKLQRERELREVQGKIIENTKKLNAIIAKRKSIESQIIDIKINTFDQIINNEDIQTQTLILK